MFAALKLCATAMLVASLAAAVDIQVPQSAASGGMTTVTWTEDPSLPVFSIELFHTTFNDAIAIANNVDPAKGNINVTLPMVPPGGGYTLEFVNITDIDQTYATSDEFSIAPPMSTTESSSATATGSAVSQSAGSAAP
ncbi:hypothetical protein B0H19DRAFT_1279595 [Mycena capillaripes]|nr:hypothetical protein B0H19DRAFT_1279595 [Mycena capillaripes]